MKCSKKHGRMLYCDQCGFKNWSAIIVNAVFCAVFMTGGLLMFNRGETFGEMALGITLVALFYLGGFGYSGLKGTIGAAGAQR